MSLLSRACTLVSKTVNSTFDLKVWYLLFLYIGYFANTYFFEHSAKYLQDIAHVKSNICISFLYLLFFVMWLQSFVTEVAATNLHFSIMRTTIGILIVLLINMYLFVIMGINTYIVLFILIIMFGFMDFNGLWAAPLAAPWYSFDRASALYSHIASHGKTKLDDLTAQLQMEGKSWTFEWLLKRALHFYYDRALYYTILLWLIYCAQVFYTQLTVVNLQHNMLTMVMMAAFAVMLFRFAYEYFFAKSK